jgi:hypothetical protein
MRLNIILASIMVLAMLGCTKSNEDKDGGLDGANQIGDLVPRDGKGNAVDWWFLIKMPQGATSVCTGCANPGCQYWQSSRSGGVCYWYADSNNPTLQPYTALGFDCLTGPNNPLTRTLNQMKGKTYIIWNDQGSKTSKPNTYPDEFAPIAHSKGAAAFGDETGFIMNVSTPDFPDPDLYTVGCQEDDNVEVSQHFFCFSADKASMTAWANAMANAQLSVISKNNWTFADTTVGGHSTTANLKTLGNLPVTLVVKGSQDFFIPWDYVTNSIGSGVKALNWYASPETPPIGTGSTMTCLYKSPAQFDVDIVRSLQTPDGAYSWCGQGNSTTYNNHAKIGIGINTSWVVAGSMNMQGDITSAGCTSSQMGRGGDFYAFQNQNLWTGLNTMFKSWCEATDAGTCNQCP